VPIFGAKSSPRRAARKFFRNLDEPSPPSRRSEHREALSGSGLLRKYRGLLDKIWVKIACSFKPQVLSKQYFSCKENDILPGRWEFYYRYYDGWAVWMKFNKPSELSGLSCSWSTVLPSVAC